MYQGNFSWQYGASSFTFTNGTISSTLNNWSINNGNVSISGGGNFTTDGPIAINGYAYFGENVCIHCFSCSYFFSFSSAFFIIFFFIFFSFLRYLFL
jgi:hypothetical protein